MSETHKRLGTKPPSWLGRKLTEEHKTNISKGNKGRVHSEETKQKIRLKALGREVSQETKDKMSKTRKGRTVSDETRRKCSEARRGSKNYSWKGGVTNENDIVRRSLEYRMWRDTCFERDNYTCQKTKMVGGPLQVHHINNFADNKELRFDVDNGITLSEDQHILFHKIYGYKNNTREQLDEFLNN